MSIRKATINDLDQVHAIFCLYLEFYQREIDSTKTLKFLNDRIRNNESVIFIFSENDNVLGFVQLYPSFSSLRQSRTWILNDLYVDINSRGKGIGQRLIETAVAHSRNEGATGLSLQTAIENRPAQSLYEKLGWIKDAKYLTYYYSINR